MYNYNKTYLCRYDYTPGHPGPPAGLFGMSGPAKSYQKHLILRKYLDV